jgi:hypothetical protein
MLQMPFHQHIYLKAAKQRILYNLKYYVGQPSNITLNHVSVYYLPHSPHHNQADYYQTTFVLDHLNCIRFSMHLGSPRFSYFEPKKTNKAFKGGNGTLNTPELGNSCFNVQQRSF